LKSKAWKTEKGGSCGTEIKVEAAACVGLLLASIYLCSYMYHNFLSRPTFGAALKSFFTIKENRTKQPPNRVVDNFSEGS
jgi:hypothetical protein